MKRASILLAILGVGLGIGLVVWLGAGKVVHAVTSVGWIGFAVLVGWQFLVFIVLAEAWRLLCRHGRFGALVFGRLVREGGTNILPFSEVGGTRFRRARGHAGGHSVAQGDRLLARRCDG